MWDCHVKLSGRKLNLAGDQEADLTVHGGAEKAVCAYPAEHYEYWRKTIPEVPFSWGKFGENLTTEGLAEDMLCIGDRLRVGSAILMVTQPRMPLISTGRSTGSHSHSGQILTDQSMLCYNFIHGAGTAALGWSLPVAQCGRRFNLVSMVSINLRIWFYGVEMGDTGETIEREESQ
jgi:MOSC domain-containing protein